MPLNNIKLGKKVTLFGKVNVTGTLADGLGWYVKKEMEGIVLHYLSGSHGGGEEKIVISNSEFELLSSSDEPNAVIEKIHNDRYNKRHGLT